MHKKIFTPEQERDLIARYNAGESTVALGRAFGMGKSTVNNILRRLGVRLRTELASKRLTVEQDDELVAMLRDGVTRERASAHFGLSVNAARKLVEERELSLQTGRPRTCEVDDAAFDVLTPEAMYWAGFIFADGCVHNTGGGTPRLVLGIGEKDFRHILKFKAFLKSTYAISRTTSTTALGGYCMYHAVRSRQICERLNALGVVKKRVCVPAPELAASTDFWRGAVDGDGWLGWNDGPYIGLSGQLPLIETFCSFLADSGVTRDGKIVKTESGIWRVQVGVFGDWDVGAAERLITLLYERATIALDRKHERARALIQGRDSKFPRYVDATFEEHKSIVSIDDALLVALDKIVD